MNRTFIDSSQSAAAPLDILAVKVLPIWRLTWNSLFNLTKMSFRGLTADRRPIDEFRARIPGTSKKIDPASENYLPLHAFEWLEGENSGVEIADLKSVGELVSHSRGAARIVSVLQPISKLKLISIASLLEMIRLPVLLTGFLSSSKDIGYRVHL